MSCSDQRDYILPVGNIPFTIFDLETKKTIAKHDGLYMYKSLEIKGATGAARVPSKELIAVGRRSTGLLVFDRNNFSLFHEFPRCHTDTVRSTVAGKHLVFTESLDTYVCGYNTETKENISKWKMQETRDSIWFKRMYYVNEMDWLSIPSNKKGIILADIKTEGKKILHLQGFASKVYTTPVDMEKNIVYGGTNAGLLSMFDIRTGKRIKDMKCKDPHNGAVRSICLTPVFGNNTIVNSEGTWDCQNSISIWDLRKFQRLKFLKNVHQKYITEIVPHSPGKILTISWDRTVKKIGIVGEGDVFTFGGNRLNNLYHFREYGAVYSKKIGYIEEDQKERTEYVVENYTDFTLKLLNFSCEIPKFILRLEKL